MIGPRLVASKPTSFIAKKFPFHSPIHCTDCHPLKSPRLQITGTSAPSTKHRSINGFHAFSSSQSSSKSIFHSELSFIMADQCIVCLENLDSALPVSQSLSGDCVDDDGGGNAAQPKPELEVPATPAAPKPAAAAPSTPGKTTTKIEDQPYVSNNVAADIDNIVNNDNIAVIQICGHVLHDSCLKAWTGKANSCPICRQAFHLVEVYDKVGGEFHSDLQHNSPPGSGHLENTKLIISAQEPFFPPTKSKIRNKLPSSTLRHGWMRAPMKRRSRDRVRFAIPQTTKMFCSCATDAMHLITPTALA